MALTRQDAVVSPFVRGLVPNVDDTKATLQYILGELQRLERAINTLAIIIPQVAISEPDQKLTGIIRFPKSPWNPIGAGGAPVYYNGTAWTAV